MKKDIEKTLVVFREFKDGEIIALFPEIAENNYLCSSYMNIGQHGAACYHGVIEQTKPAKDFKKLEKELERIGYSLDIKKKYIRK